MNEFTRISIDFVLAFPQENLDVDVFMDILLVMGVDRNIVEWVIKINKSLYGIKQERSYWFELFLTGL